MNARWYDRNAIAHNEDGSTVEIHTDAGAVAQISLLPKGDGFLIRVWRRRGTAEYGGDNTTIVAATVQDDVLTALDYWVAQTEEKE